MGKKTSVQSLEEERSKLKKRLRNLQIMLAEELLDVNDFKEQKKDIDSRINEIDDIISNYEMEQAKIQKKVFDIEAIKERMRKVTI